MDRLSALRNTSPAAGSVVSLALGLLLSLINIGGLLPPATSG